MYKPNCAIINIFRYSNTHINYHITLIYVYSKCFFMFWVSTTSEEVRVVEYDQKRVFTCNYCCENCSVVFDKKKYA